MLMQAFKVMPKEAQTKLRAHNKVMMASLATKMQSAARNSRNPKQAQIVAKSIKANSDRFPSLTIGGARKAPVSRKGTGKSPKPTYGELLYGVEFGAGKKNGFLPNGGRRFPIWSGREGNGSRGYFIFPTLRKNQERIRQDYLETVYKILKRRWG